MAKLWQWNEGRQQTGYYIWPVIMFPRFDIYFLKYRSGTGIFPHKDPVKPGLAHYRLNITVWGLDRREEVFKCANVIYSSPRIKLFRPDVEEHSVEVVKNTRIVLSIGWIRRVV